MCSRFFAPYISQAVFKAQYNRIVCNCFCTKASTTQEFDNFKVKIINGPSLPHFIRNERSNTKEQFENTKQEIPSIPYIDNNPVKNQGRKVYIETYGCQMNVSDTEVIRAVLQKAGFSIIETFYGADVILLVTCAIREGAEQKIWRKLHSFKVLKQRQRSCDPPVVIGLLGCMAEHLKHKVLEKEKYVDVVAGPDSYRDLPNLLSLASEGQKAVNVMLSADETYADIMPIRVNPNLKTAFVSIMRGCENMCTYCIVPFTRGKERSRPLSSILDEIRHLSDQGYKEVTLLGQNVNSYRDLSGLDQYSIVTKRPSDELSKGFTTVYRQRIGGWRFSDLLEKAADINPELRIRFTSPHPKDFPDPVLQVIKEKPNVCNHIHLPAQSGNTEVLSLMGRGHTREAYLELVEHIREVIPDVALTSDFISGFCGETEEAHQDTLSLIEKVKYEYAYVFPYSMRSRTAAFYKLKDNVPEDVKKCRAEEVHAVFRKYALELHQREIGREHLVLVGGPSKRSDEDWSGRNDWNTKVIFPYTAIPVRDGSCESRVPAIGDYVVVKIRDCSSQVLKGEALCHTTLQEFSNVRKNSDTSQYIERQIL